MQSDSNIKKRRNDEKVSLGKLRSKWEEKTSTLQQKFDKITKKFDEETNFLVDRTDKWNRLKVIDIKKNFSNLEDSYSDKLKLEKPVEYWQEIAKDYKKSGYMWIGLLGAICVLALIAILILLYNPPESFSNASLINADPLAIRNVILFVTMLSIVAYAIKTFAKFATSSFHLRRDAKEREQLTMVYLALLRGGSIKPEERDLILEAIFSRSDTGLIQGGNDQLFNSPLINRFSNIR